MKAIQEICRIYVLLSVILLGIAMQSSAQEQPGRFWDHVRFGGGFGLGFGNGYFGATLAPSAIYEFSPEFAAGIGLSGSYISEKDVYSSVLIGGSVLALYNLIPELQLSLELEELNESRLYGDNVYFIQEPETNFWYTALFAGLGYRAANVTVGVRYDLLYSEGESIYGTAWMPFVRVYF